VLTGHWFDRRFVERMSIDRLQIEATHTPTASEDAASPERGITFRVVITGFVTIVPGVFWGVYGDVVSRTDLTSVSLMMPPVLILTALVALNAVIRRIRPRWTYSRTELMTVYTMLTVSVILSGMGMLQFLCTTLRAVPHYATPDNGWNEYMHRVPSWILPRLSAIDGFYKGGEPVPWGAWRTPILVWSGFLFSMLFCMLCINTMVRKQWMDRERLIFPIVQLPLEMTDPKGSFFRNKLMWTGFLIAMGLETMNSLNFLYPNVPYIQLRAYDLTTAFQTPPWSALGYFPITFYPLAIGLGFVLSTEVSFSCWFFYLFTKVENVFAAAIGWKGGAGAVMSTPPYIGEQGTGAFVGITIVVLWLARRHLKDVLRKAFWRGSGVDDSGEPMSYPMAMGGLAVGFVAMVAFCTVVGVSPLVATIYLGLYLIFATTITRLRAEAGPAWVMGPDVDATNTLIRPVGSGLFSRQTMIALAYFSWFSIEMRCCPMPVQIEGMKMAQATRVRQRAMLLVMLVAIVLGIAVGFWACLKCWYQFGAGTAQVEPWRTYMGKVPFDRVTGYFNNPTSWDPAAILAMLFGAGFTFLLSATRSQFTGFPFHPAGYVLANTGTMYWLWCPFMIAWICKVVITKYGGIKGYRTALPFFLGLLFGDYVTSSLWALAGWILGIEMYRCFPC